MRITAFVIAALLIASPANALTERQENQCRYQSLDRAVWTQREEIRTARCVVDRWSVPGGLPYLRRVIECESGWGRFAYNPAGPYVGLAQHALSYWPERVNHQMPDGWRVGPWTRWTNSRSQIVTTARMAHNSGWRAWSCA